ncbi:hypothetical protein [Paenibacillus sp. 7541]|nr:hypothetical protein [Paenibacillus sp. 7541]
MLLVMYAASGFLLFVASDHAPYLLPVIWISALLLLLCGIAYIGHHYFYRARKKRG